MPKSFYKFQSVGKRKNAIARVFMNPGSGNITINTRALEEYFPTKSLQIRALKAFGVAGGEGISYDVCVRVNGGGVSAQASAVAHGVAKALVGIDETLRKPLRSEGLLTRDAREKERKKYGQPGARKRFQYSKR